MFTVKTNHTVAVTVTASAVLSAIPDLKKNVMLSRYFDKCIGLLLEQLQFPVLSHIHRVVKHGASFPVNSCLFALIDRPNDGIDGVAGV